MVYLLVEGLANRGHEVELFASGDSQVAAKLHSVVPVATLYDETATFYLDKEMETRNTYNLYRQAHRFDIIHSHWPSLAPYFSSFTEIPTVVTYAYIEEHLHQYYRTWFPKVQPVCISKAQARLLGDEELPVIYNGIDVEAVPFNGNPEDFVILVGRIVPNKGISEAIRIAQARGLRLIIVGDVTPYIPWSQRYYEEAVKPYVDGQQVVHIQNLPNKELLRLVGRAKAFLFPIQWEEPFGLVVVEAMAAGTPVIALRHGSMPELILHGETGFLADTEEEMERALQRVESIERRRCRQWVESHFSAQEMTEQYERLYQRLLRR